MKTLLFVDDEPNVLEGLERQLRSMRNGWDMHFLASGKQALEFMAGHTVDIVVSDMMMSGMDGSQLLIEILERHPQTVRIVLSGHSEHKAVLRLVGPAHQYLSKPCDPDELRGAIARAFALRDLLDNERLKQLTARIKNLPSLPALHNALTEELRKDSCSVERVGEIISQDIAMTAKILQLVNSAFFGPAQPIDNPMDAVIYLGVSTIESLVLSVGIFSRFDQMACRSFSLDALQQHSWFVGTLARLVAKLEDRETKILDQCFLAGLLHDVGQLVFAYGLPNEYAEVLTRSRGQNLPLWEVEREVFGASHTEVGAYLIALWGLPNPIIEAVAFHHQPASCATAEFSPGVAVHIADVFAHELSGANTEVPPPRLDLTHLVQLGLAGRIETWQSACHELLGTTNAKNL